ncbi:uncharacterized protein mRpL53 isoform X2 [Drosophila montana]|uniref:uncharacterized protein mRpL53 isoform X2 n=1 Tax=Drosophila montana TaxID=40370 RepID=UPI00313ADFCD
MCMKIAGVLGAPLDKRRRRRRRWRFYSKKMLFEFLFLLSTPKVSQTNPNCVVKPDIVCDRSPALIKFALIDSAQEKSKVKEIRFNSENLNTLELLQLCNKHVSSLAPPEEVANKVLTKAEKQKLGGGGKKVIKKK